jgi:Flp pilus assembly protein TadB
VGSPLAQLVEDMGIDTGRLRRDLRILGRSLDYHMATKVGSAVFGAFIVAAAATLPLLAGVGLPGGAAAWGIGALALAAGLFFAPDISVRVDAARRRRDFRHALSSFLDLVVVVLAGGGGVDGALALACRSGGGWAYDELRGSLRQAQLLRQTPWTALGRLGEQLGIDELQDLASSVSLAATQGAPIRESLVAKAASIRGHLLSEAESTAAAATERMSFPVVLLAFGFVGLLLYPAAASILNQLSSGRVLP